MDAYKFTASEFNKLSYIARYPNTPHAQRLFKVLHGHAHDVARVLRGEDLAKWPGYDQPYIDAMKAIAKLLRRGRHS